MSLYPGVPGAISSRLGAARGRLLARPTGQPAASTGPSLTTSQVANRQVSSLLAPQIRAQTAYAAHQNDVIRSFANSLLGKLQPIAGQIGQAYDTGVQQIGALSNQAASYLQGQNPSAQVSPLLQAVNAPAEQQAQIQGKLGQTFGGGAGVLAFTGGVIPGQALAEQGAAAKASALQLPAIAALKGQQDLASAAWQQGQDMAKIQAQRPELYQTAVKNIQTNQAARAKLAQGERAAAEKIREFNLTRSDKQAAAKATAAYRQGQLGLGYYKANLSAADKAAQRKETAAYHDAYLGHLAAGDTERQAHDAALEAAAQTRNRISQQQANTAAVRANNDAAAAQRRADIAQQNADTAARRGAADAADKKKRAAIAQENADTAKKQAQTARIRANAYAKKQTQTARPRPLTPNESAKYTRSAQQIAFNARHGGTDAKGVVHPPVSYQEAVKEMRTAGLFADPRLQRLAQQALDRQYGEGEAGRPVGVNTRRAVSTFRGVSRGIFGQ